MPKLKTLSGHDVLKIFAKFGFEKVDQEGSHVKIRKAIFRQAPRYIPEGDLHPHFYYE
jgi:predicted RNA binding protein YcfA (HicA-like mRNA interferase family)